MNGHLRLCPPTTQESTYAPPSYINHENDIVAVRIDIHLGMTSKFTREIIIHMHRMKLGQGKYFRPQISNNGKFLLVVNSQNSPSDFLST
jgi:hypothetical protein